MKHQTRQRLAWGALAVAVGAAAAGAQMLRTVDAGGGLYLQQIGGRAVLREPSGEASELSLPRGAAIRRLEPLDGGWIAAGEIDAPGVTDLLLIVDAEGDRRPLAAPPNAAGEPLRAGPMPLVEDGRLAGLAWLAGPGVRQTAVWASRWSGLDWSQPELVSRPGPGTQIAIDGAVLADGSWLLVWSAYDGEDDEILWSRRVEGVWSEPARLHEPNDTPDITPALTATGRGALAAWNWYDGRIYRVRLARFEEGVWTEVEPGARPVGVRPDLTPSGEGALLLYRTVRPAGWTQQELDGGGAVLRSAVADTESTFQPGLAPAGELAAGFEWPGREISAPERLDVEWRAEP